MSYKIEHNGKTIELPDFKNLKVGLIRKARKSSPDELMWTIVEGALDEKQLAILDTMSMEEFNSAMTGWTQGAPLGESLQSSKS
jgi:hypothetical protein